MDYKEINDYELLYMISGNDYSFEILLDKYKPFIEKKLRRYANCFKKYGVDIEDLKQELYLAVIYAINNYDQNGNASFYTYLNRLVEYRLSNFWREQFSYRNSAFFNSVSLSLPIGENLTLADLLTDKSYNIEDIIAEKNVVMKIKDFCYDLPLEEAYVFELYIDGFSRESISLLLDIPYKKITYFIAKFKNKLKNFLLKEELLVV